MSGTVNRCGVGGHSPAATEYRVLRFDERRDEWVYIGSFGKLDAALDLRDQNTTNGHLVRTEVAAWTEVTS